MPSIVDPAESRGGAWTVTRGVIAALRLAWPGCHVDCIPLEAPGVIRHRVRQVTSVAGSIIFGGLPAKMRFTRTHSLRRRVNSAIEGSTPDVIILNGGDLLWLAGDMPPNVPVVVVAHNIEQVLYARRIDALGRARSLAPRALAGDARRLGVHEMRGMAQAAGVVFLSEDDRRAMETALNGVRTAVVPPVFNYSPAARSRRAGERIELGMFADFNWWPNRRSLDWFMDNVWPSVSSHCRLNLLGHASDEMATGIPDVRVHGLIDDPRNAFAACDIMIAPIIDGAGIKVKVAEALYNGVPVVATPFAVRGLPIEPSVAVKVCDTAREWIAFLSSGQALCLAVQQVDAGLQDTFSVARGACLLRDFLDPILARKQQ